MVGRSLSHYEILEKLGEGGMGVVYKARDPRLDRFVAVKVLPPGKVTDPERKRRFIQEAKAASALNHPNIVTIHDIGSEDGADFIVMEYIAGRPLNRAIPRQGMRLAEALDCAIPVADALAKAHAAGIVHRDLKPGNIMLANDGTVKLLDFGLAKLVENVPPSDQVDTLTTGPDSAPLTESGVLVGTVAYMSPEQAEARPVDARSDVFSFGSMLYEMLTGRRAFQGESLAATLAAILREEPKPASVLVPGLPHELDRVIARCLRKDPARRWQSMADLSILLQELKVDSESGTSRVISPVKAQSSARRGVLVAVISVLVVGAALTAWFLRGTGAPPDEMLHPIPLTSFPGTEDEPSFSPDGSQLAFSWDGEKQDNLDIYVKRIGTAQPLRLTDNPAPERYPAWSPDGNSIAFLRQSEGKLAVVLIPPLRGPEQVISEVNLIGGVAQVLTWAPNGEWLVVFDRPASQAGGLFLLSVGGDERRRLTTVVDDPAATDVFPSFSPDGRTLAFQRKVDVNSGELYVLSLAADLSPLGEPRRLTAQNQLPAGAAWTGDGKDMVFSSGSPAISISGELPFPGMSSRNVSRTRMTVTSPYRGGPGGWLSSATPRNWTSIGSNYLKKGTWPVDRYP